jgi:hypothetical protein
MFERALFTAVCATSLFAGVAGAQDRKDDPKGAEVQKKEAFVQKEIVTELSRLATWCAGRNGFDDGRRALEVGLGIFSEDPLLSAQLEKLKGKTGTLPKGFREDLAKKESSSYAKCAKLLAQLVAFAADRGNHDHFEERVETIAMKLHCEQALEQPGHGAIAVWFAPYRRWVSQADFKRLEAGCEQIDGAWVQASEVKKLDERHATWSDPWLVSDDVHEIKTTMSYRVARQLLAHVAAFRQMFLRYVADAWELRLPQGKLPIVVTATQDDFRDQMKRAGHWTDGGNNMAAVYIQSTAPLSPVYVTFEPMDETGKTRKVGFDGLETILQHEVTHQLASECSSWNAEAGTLGADYQFWCVEGLAAFMETWQLGRSGWRLTHSKPTAVARQKESGHSFAFASFRARVSLPELRTMFDTPRAQFVHADQYDFAATLTYFLLEGEGRRYREGFLHLLALEHARKIQASSLETCFPGVSWGEVQTQFRRFVSGIALDD